MVSAWRTLLGLAPLALWASAQAQDPVHRRFTVADGLPSNTVYSVTQDHRGFLWFGTDAGASRFDGRHFVNFGHREELPDEEVLYCLEDSRHRLWLLLLNGRLAYIRNDSVFHAGNDTALAAVNGRSGWVRACEDHQGRIWFGGIWGELIMLDTNGRFESIDLTRIGVTGSIITPMVDRAGDVFIQIGPAGYRVKGRELQPTYAFTPAAPKPVYHASRDGRIWCADSVGLLEVGRARGPVVIDAAKLGPWDRARSMIIPGNGPIIYGRWDQGAVIAFPDEGTVRNIFELETINGVGMDDEGNCWLITAGGGVLTFALEQIGSRIITKVNGRDIGPTSRIHADAGGNTWVGTVSGSVLRLSEQKAELFDLRQGDMLVQEVRAICDDGRCAYIATDVTTVRLPLQGGAPQMIGCDRNDGHGVNRTPNKVLAIQPDGSLVSAFYELMRSPDPQSQPLRPWLAKPFGFGRYHFIHVDPDGGVWIQRNDMLYRSSGGRIDTLAFLKPFTGVRITGMGTLSDGTVVLATLGHGLLFLREGEDLKRFREEDGLLSDRCNRMQARGDTLAVATALGAQVLLYDGRTHACTALPAVHGPAVMDAQVLNGELYMATAEGVVIGASGARNKRPRPPRPHVTSVMSGDLSFVPGERFVLDADHRSLDLVVAVVSLQPSASTELQYRIDDAAEWTSSSTNTFTLLLEEPGEHRVHLRARIPGSAWSSTVEIPFALYPPLWMRNIFRLPIAAALLLAGFFVIRWSAQRRYAKRLQEMKQREALGAERQRIAMDLHDDLGADLAGTMMLAEAAMAGGQEPRAALGATIARVRSIIPKVESIVWALDARNDSLRSLLSYLERTISAQTKALGIRSEFVAPWNVEDHALGPDLRRVVLLLVKESVNNALKHAGCDLLEILVSVDGGRLSVEIRDNGHGITLTEEAATRSGLSNMLSRARSAGGTVTVTRTEPRGTCVVIQLPLAKSRRLPENGMFPY